MIIVKIILVITFALILYQDVTERMVYWFLFPLSGLLSAILFYDSVLPEVFAINVAMNLLLTLFIFILTVLIAKYIIKKPLYEVIGIGDLILYVALAFSFATVSYYVIFISSLLFTFALGIVFSKFRKIVTVPVGGYVSLFFMIAHLSYWTGVSNNLYSI